MKITRASAPGNFGVHPPGGRHVSGSVQQVVGGYIYAGRVCRYGLSAKARKSDSDTYPGRPSILLSDSQLYTPGRLENLRNHFSMGVPCLTLLLELFSELSLVFICSSEPSALQKSTASIVLPQQQYHPRGDNFTARYSSSNSPILFSIVISRECPATILSARLFSSPGILALRIVLPSDLDVSRSNSRF